MRLPSIPDVKEGIIAAKIAAHAGDLAKGLPGAREWDNRMSDARQKLDWDAMFDQALDREKAEEYFKSTNPTDKHTCTMCGKMCAVRNMNRIMNGENVLLK